MSIPQLSTCCCGCSLRTGTKIIGWISLLMGVTMLVFSAAGLASLYYIEDHPTPETEKIRDHLPVLKVFTMFLIAVHTIGCGLALMLLLGTYQSKPKLVYLWVLVTLTSSLVEQAVNLTEAIAFSQPSKLLGILFFGVDLYFILVVYSFYREIKNLGSHA